MKTQHKPDAPSPTADRLSGVRALAHDDDDERPSGQDLRYGQTIFNRGTVPLPRFLVPKRKRQH
jgi:hypothetical protein